MTRINVGIPAKKLTNRHLLAEHREIKRIPNNLVKRFETGKPISKGPKDFCLGKGHVTFFNDKIPYLFERYIELRNECIARGFNVADYSEAFTRALAWSYSHKSYKPTLNDIKLIVERLQQRDAYNYSTLHPYRLWYEQLRSSISKLNSEYPGLFSHIKIS